MLGQETPEDTKAAWLDGAFFWFVVLRVVLAVAVSAGVFVYFTLGYYFGFLDDATFDRHAAVWDRIWESFRFASPLLLCILVAAWHRIGFGRSIVLLFAGNIVANLICLPLLAAGWVGEDDSGWTLATGWFGEEYASETWIGGYAAILLIYAGGSGYAIVRRRRQTLTRARQRDVVKVFD